MQTQVLRQVKLIKDNLKNWDNKFLEEQGRVANCNDYTNSIEWNGLIHKKKTALKLLQSWNISVHL